MDQNDYMENPQEEYPDSSVLEPEYESSSEEELTDTSTVDPEVKYAAGGDTESAILENGDTSPVVNEANIIPTSTKKEASMEDILDASTRVKNFIDLHKRLPNFVTVAGEQVLISDFLYISVKGLLGISSGQNGNIAYESYGLPANSSGTSNLRGTMLKKDYLDLASRIGNFMDANGVAPNFGRSTRGNIKFESAVYLFARILDFQNINKQLPNYAYMAPLNQVRTTPLADTVPVTPGNNNTNPGNNTPDDNNTNPGNDTSNPGNNTPDDNNTNPGNSTPGENTEPPVEDNPLKVTVGQILDAANRVKAFVEKNKALPNFVTIGNMQINMSQFLYLLSAGLVQINTGSNGDIAFGDFKAPTASSGNQLSNSLNRNSYMDLAGRIKDFMENNLQAPNFGNTNNGRIKFESMVYMFSKIMSFHSNQGRLPTFVTLADTNAVATTYNQNQSAGGGGDKPDYSAYAIYLANSQNCQVTNSAIVNLANSLTSGLSSTWDKAEAIFNWVRDRVSYSFYYNTRYGALGTLNSRTGNCVDQSHLVVALTRAAGIPTRYAHGDCTFSSGSRYGHVWAEILINGNWVRADPSSSRNRLGVINNWNTGTASIKGYYASLPF